MWETAENNYRVMGASIDREDLMSESRNAEVDRVELKRHTQVVIEIEVV